MDSRKLSRIHCVVAARDIRDLLGRIGGSHLSSDGRVILLLVVEPEPGNDFFQLLAECGLIVFTLANAIRSDIYASFSAARL
jgi:hypothetical protein